MVYIYTMEYYSAIKKNEITPLTATWMDLERKIKMNTHAITYTWSLKYNTNELIYETEMDSWT